MSTRYNLMKEKLRKKHASLKIPPTIKEEITNTSTLSSSSRSKKKSIENTDDVYIQIGSEHLCKHNCDGCKNTFYKDKTKPKFKLVTMTCC